MIAHLRFLMAVGLLSLTAACVTQQPVVLRNPVGPDPTVQARSASEGFLTVYTAMKTYPMDDETYYRVHTDYGIYDATGHRLLSVRNAATYHDPTPRTVALPEGRYMIEGWTDGYQLLKVPVVIKAGRATIVNLEATRNNLFPAARGNDVVRAPDGQIIGWSANVS
ncbi:MAG: hypothetical protein ABSA12_04320 [Verrucomicrobiia bacterium]|jgi:hypothetical protein